MITREDILEQAAARIYLGIDPARAIAQAYGQAFHLTHHQIMDFCINTNLKINLAYILDVSPELNYILYYPTAAAKMTMSPYVHGSLIDDLNHRGESHATVSKYLLAFVRAGEMSHFPTELLDLVDVEKLRPLPSRANAPDPLASPRVVQPEDESFDPDLDEDPDEGILYDDLAD